MSLWDIKYLYLFVCVYYTYAVYSFLYSFKYEEKKAAECAMWHIYVICSGYWGSKCSHKIFYGFPTSLYRTFEWEMNRNEILFFCSAQSCVNINEEDYNFENIEIFVDNK